MDTAAAESYEKESVILQYEKGLELMDLLSITENSSGIRPQLVYR